MSDMDFKILMAGLFVTWAAILLMVFGIANDEKEMRLRIKALETQLSKP